MSLPYRARLPGCKRSVLSFAFGFAQKRNCAQGTEQKRRSRRQRDSAQGHHLVPTSSFVAVVGLAVVEDPITGRIAEVSVGLIKSENHDACRDIAVGIRLYEELSAGGCPKKAVVIKKPEVDIHCFETGDGPNEGFSKLAAECCDAESAFFRLKPSSASSRISAAV